MMTIENAIERVAERTYENSLNINQMKHQRRNQVVDLYGVEYTRQGDNGIPATFYVSISPDMVYLERFEFKLIIQPFVNTAGISTTPSISFQTDATTLSGAAITPNPHKHSMTLPGYVVTAEISQKHTTASDFRVYIDGIDITAYLMAQYGSWINGEGVYPSLDIGQEYDILEVASDMCAEGRFAEADALTKAGYKRIEITSGSAFSVTLVNYLKYSHALR